MRTAQQWLAGGLALMVCASAIAQDSKKTESGASAAGSPEAVMESVVQLKVKSLPNARSNATLGPSREGSGIVIDAKGHVLTIGYLVIEAESIELTTSENKTVPATMVGYDHATGFGVLRATQPLGVKPIDIGSAASLNAQEPVIILPHGGRQSASIARVMSKRPFAGSWEYQLDQAIFVSPPTQAWAGAALINRELKLVGVGSLLVRDSSGDGSAAAGNMFVPIDVLKPILADLISKGKRNGPTRPWLGLATEEFHGRLLVTRVSPESPAEKAGLKPGDLVLGVGKDSVTNHAELYGKMWGVGAAGVDVPLKVLQGAEMRDIKVKSIDRAEYFRDKPVH
ncbi:MAG: S1C family serine protease [Burkholderiales bacterium]